MKNTNITGDFRKFMDKSFLGSWDIEPNEENGMRVTIASAQMETVKNERGEDEKLTISFTDRKLKHMILNQTNGGAISTALGSSKIENWIGKDILLYTEKVTAFGTTTDAIRVRPYAPAQSGPIICEACGFEINDAVINGKKYTAEQIARSSKKKYGSCMCYDCTQTAKEIENKKKKESDLLA